MALYVGQPKDYEGPEMMVEVSLLHATKVDSSILKEVEQTLAACIIPAWSLSRLRNSLEVWPLKQESVDAVLRGLLSEPSPRHPARPPWPGTAVLLAQPS